MAAERKRLRESQVIWGIVLIGAVVWYMGHLAIARSYAGVSDSGEQTTSSNQSNSILGGIPGLGGLTGGIPGVGH